MLVRKKIPLCVLSLIMGVNMLAQISKGDKYFENLEYQRAISSYKKASRKEGSPARQEALVKLAKSYVKVSDYKKAETAYQEAIAMEVETDPRVFYEYAQVLKVNNQYEEAATQYRRYVEKAPDDLHAKDALNFCLEIRYYLTKPREYAVSNVSGVNTSLSEFSPFVTGNKLMFIAQRESFDFVNYPIDAGDGAPFLSMYVSSMDGTQLKKPRIFSKKLASKFHDGPGCISSNGNTLYFTKVQGLSKGKINHAGIYTATRDEHRWKNMEPLAINSDEYSVAHPAISHDNQLLVFSSDMPGGYGGKDLWLCKRAGDNWLAPVNLGPDINTSGDEMFPSFRKDGILFFASNGLPGFGGLDIYSARFVESKWLLQRNEGLDINSSADDFGIAFLNDTLGYFSSNRIGGKGKDDIYLYEYSNKSMEMSGTILLTENLKDFAKHKKMVLFDDSGIPVDSTYTDGKGRFVFKNLDSEKRYMAVLAEEDPALFGKARYFLVENDSVIHRVSARQGSNRFVFRDLPIDPNGLPELYTDDDLVFAGSLMSGEKGTMAVKFAKLKLINDFGDVVEETTTNEFGAFAFRKIPSQQNYLISIEESDVELPAGTKITLTNKTGNEVKTFYKQGKGKFQFKVLQTDRTTLDEMEAEDVNLVMGIYGYVYDQDKKPIANLKIIVKDEQGVTLQDFVTTRLGKFNFKNLEAEKNYLFEADQNDPALSGVHRIFIADNKGRIYKVIEMSDGTFSFKILEVDKTVLGEFVVDDPWLKVVDHKQTKEKEKAALVASGGKEPVAAVHKKEPEKAPKNTPEDAPENELDVVIVESIYYAYGDYKLGSDGERILNKAVEALREYPKLVMEISSHTDARSSAQFNLTLSKKRAQACVDYMVRKGISRSRLKAKGYGESRLLNKCADGVECSDEQHKVNRRTEFKITKPIK